MRQQFVEEYLLHGQWRGQAAFLLLRQRFGIGEQGAVSRRERSNTMLLDRRRVRPGPHASFWPF
jgi:hypothetical protein